jgi:hypothetical protein
MGTTRQQTAQQQLILVTKVLQNLANNTLPGMKEAYMEKLNTFIVTNKPTLDQFYNKMVSHPKQGKLTDCNVPRPPLPGLLLIRHPLTQLLTDCQVPLRVRNDALIRLRKFLATHFHAIETYLRDDDEGGDDIISDLRQLLRKDLSPGKEQV